METRIRPLSSPCEAGFDVFGRLTSGPFRICGAITMNMISSTSTTSTSGVMLMVACIFAGSPSRIRRPPLLDWHLHLLFIDLRQPHLRYFEQAVQDLGGSPVHLDVKSLDLARKVIESDDGRDRDEDAQGRRDERLSDSARDHRHPAGPGGRDVPESVDDADDCAEETDEWGGGTDRGQEPQPLLQLDQRLGQGVPEYTRNELQRGDRIASPLAHAVVLENARRNHLRHVGFPVLRNGGDQFLEISSAQELPEHGLKDLRLARGRAETKVLVHDHSD